MELLYLLMCFALLPFEEPLCPLDYLRKGYASGFDPQQELVPLLSVQIVSAKTSLAEGSSFGRGITRRQPSLY